MPPDYISIQLRHLFIFEQRLLDKAILYPSSNFTEFTVVN